VLVAVIVTVADCPTLMVEGLIVALVPGGSPPTESCTAYVACPLTIVLTWTWLDPPTGTAISENKGLGKKKPGGLVWTVATRFAVEDVPPMPAENVSVYVPEAMVDDV
jgi:hypothetical protein